MTVPIDTDRTIFKLGPLQQRILRIIEKSEKPLQGTRLAYLVYEGGVCPDYPEESVRVQIYAIRKKMRRSGMKKTIVNIPQQGYVVAKVTNR